MAATYDLNALKALAQGAGLSGTEVDIAAAVAMAESGGNPRDHSVTGDYGLWQINARSWPQFDVARLYDPAYNAQAMAIIAHTGRGWSHWTTYRTGAYRRYLTTSSSGSTVAGVPIPGIGDTAGAVTDAAGNVIDTAKDVLNLPGQIAGDWVNKLTGNLAKIFLSLLLAGAGLWIAQIGLSRLFTTSNTGAGLAGAASTAATLATI